MSLVWCCLWYLTTLDCRLYFQTHLPWSENWPFQAHPCFHLSFGLHLSFRSVKLFDASKLRLIHSCHWRFQDKGWAWACPGSILLHRDVRGCFIAQILFFFCEGFVFTALWVVSDLVSFIVWLSRPQAKGNPSVAGFCGLAKWLHYRCGTKTNRRYCETTELTSPPFCVVANVKLCQTSTVENNRKHHAPKIKSNTNNRTRGSVVSCMFRSDVLF